MLKKDDIVVLSGTFGYDELYGALGIVEEIIKPWSKDPCLVPVLYQVRVGEYPEDWGQFKKSELEVVGSIKKL